MVKNIYLSFLILCASLCQGNGTLSDEDIKQSSDLHIRKKRIVDRTPYAKSAVRIQEFPYIVSIEENGENICVGSILTPFVIITAAHCIESHFVTTIRSGSSFVNRGKRHEIKTKIMHPHYFRNSSSDDLALLKIEPPIALRNVTNQDIPLYYGPIPINYSATVVGWGCSGTTRETQNFPKKLRAINVNIIDNHICEYEYRNLMQISRVHICTFEFGRKYCHDGDSGAPLVFHGHLIGVFAGNRQIRGQIYPDIFTNLAYPKFHTWVLHHVASIHREIEHRRQ